MLEDAEYICYYWFYFGLLALLGLLFLYIFLFNINSRLSFPKEKKDDDETSLLLESSPTKSGPFKPKLPACLRNCSNCVIGMN